MEEQHSRLRVAEQLGEVDPLTNLLDVDIETMTLEELKVYFNKMNEVTATKKAVKKSVDKTPKKSKSGVPNLMDLLG